MLEQTGKLPKRVYACVGGGSNASGIFAGFSGRPGGGTGRRGSGRTGVGQRPTRGPAGAQTWALPGLLKATRRASCKTPKGRCGPTHSVSAGPGLCRRRSRSWRTCTTSAAFALKPPTDADVLALAAARHAARGHHSRLGKHPCLCHRAAGKRPICPPQDSILINQSGRGDKDIFTIAEALGDDPWRAFLRDKVGEWDAEAAAKDGGAGMTPHGGLYPSAPAEETAPADDPCHRRIPVFRGQHGHAGSHAADGRRSRGASTPFQRADRPTVRCSCAPTSVRSKPGSSGKTISRSCSGPPPRSISKS